MNGSSRKNIFVAGSGVFFILVGLFLNEWLIASWFTYSGALSVKDRIAVWIFDILMVGMGVLLIVLRGRVHLTFDKKSFPLGSLTVCMEEILPITRNVMNNSLHRFECSVLPITWNKTA